MTSSPTALTALVETLKAADEEIVRGQACRSEAEFTQWMRASQATRAVIAATLRALASPATPATEGQADVDVLKLFDDHSVALEFVREMSAQPCPQDCAGDCLKCRAKAWLHTPRAEGQGHAATPAGGT